MKNIDITKNDFQELNNICILIDELQTTIKEAQKMDIPTINLSNLLNVLEYEKTNLQYRLYKTNRIN